MKLKSPVVIGALVACGTLVASTAGAAGMHGTYHVDALGHNITNKAGSSKMTDYVKGTITLNTDNNKVCSALQEHGLGVVSSADINVGAVGTDGPSVAMLNIAQINNHKMHPACITVTHTLADAILAHPNHYYVVVSTAKYPHGAVRGQL